MYKVVFTVVEVNEPKSLDGEPTHVTGPRARAVQTFA